MANRNMLRLLGASVLLGSGVAFAYVQPRLPPWLEDPFLLIAGLAGVIVIARSWKRQRRNYRFAMVQPGVVRSPLGFEVRMSKSRLEYIEGNHVISWSAPAKSVSVTHFKLSEREIKGWDEPFTGEPMTGYKRRQVFKAVVSALLYCQLAEEGKIPAKSGD